METARNDITVLLVEDNCDDEDLARRALKKVGISRVLVAHDGSETLDMLLGPERLKSLPDLILLDLRLPKLDGIAVLQRLRAEELTRQIKVIVLTSSEDPRDKKICSDQGVVAFVSKPLTEKLLRTFLEI